MIQDTHGRRYATAVEFMKAAEVIAREIHPERYAPDGTPLIECRGQSWPERLAEWERRQSKPAETVNTWSDERSAEPSTSVGLGHVQRETAVEGSPVRASIPGAAPTHPNDEATPPASEPNRDDPAATS